MTDKNCERFDKSAPSELFISWKHLSKKPLEWNPCPIGISKDDKNFLKTLIKIARPEAKTSSALKNKTRKIDKKRKKVQNTAKNAKFFETPLIHLKMIFSESSPLSPETLQ